MNQEEDEDDCRAVEIPEPHFSNEGERLRYVEEMENNESRREILLGQIAVARGRPYEAEESGDKSKAAGLEKLIADLIVFSFGFEAFT